MPNYEKDCVSLQLESGFILSVPEEMIEERLKLIYFSKEEALKDIKMSAEKSYRNLIRRGYTVDKISSLIIEHLDSEMDVYR